MRMLRVLLVLSGVVVSVLVIGLVAADTGHTYADYLAVKAEYEGKVADWEDGRDVDMPALADDIGCFYDLYAGPRKTAANADVTQAQWESQTDWDDFYYDCITLRFNWDAGWGVDYGLSHKILASDDESTAIALKNNNAPVDSVVHAYEDAIAHIDDALTAMAGAQATMNAAVANNEDVLSSGMTYWEEFVEATWMSYNPYHTYP